MDALVAENVMEWKKSRHLGSVIFEGNVWANDMLPEYAKESYVALQHLPCFSTDIAAAWKVVEKLQERQGKKRLIFAISMFWGSVTNSWVYRCSLIPEVLPGAIDADGDTAPLAICRAALEVVRNNAL
jgi:hypothetical protein